MNKALFLDRDGVINIDKGYVYRFEDIEWCPEIFDIIKLANINSYKVIILTNQSGVAQGKYTADDVDVLHRKMASEFEKRNLVVDDWFYCTSYESIDRKPRPGMLLAAQKKHDIDLSRSYMIGDKVSDVFDIDNRPDTLLLIGKYDLKNAHEMDRVTLFKSHQEIYEFLKKKITL